MRKKSRSYERIGYRGTLSSVLRTKKAKYVEDGTKRLEAEKERKLQEEKVSSIKH